MQGQQGPSKPNWPEVLIALAISSNDLLLKFENRGPSKGGGRRSALLEVRRFLSFRTANLPVPNTFKVFNSHMPLAATTSIRVVSAVGGRECSGVDLQSKSGRIARNVGTSSYIRVPRSIHFERTGRHNRYYVY